MTRFFMMVGLPGSGKSYYAAEMVKNGEADIVVSSDAIRAELYGDESIQGNPSEVFAKVENDVVAALNNSKNVIMDATNINSKRRRAFLKTLRRRCPAFSAHCIVVATAPRLCKQNDEMRDRTVGYSVIERMWKQFEIPYPGEGWDEIRLIRYPAQFRADALVDMALGFQQFNEYHIHTLSDHMYKTGMAVMAKTNDLSVVRAAFYHDMGKVFTQFFDDENKAHYHNHGNAGAYIYLCLNHDLETEADIDILKTAALICWHMQPLMNDKDKTKFYLWAIKQGFEPSFADDLWLIYEADVKAH